MLHIIYITISSWWQIDQSFILFYIGSFSRVGNRLLLIICLQDSVLKSFQRLYDTMKRKEKPHPKDKANFVSKITLWWIFELLWKGNSRPLEQGDLYSVRDVDRAKYLTKRLEKKWENEKKCAKKSKRKPHLWKALFNFFTWREYGIIVFTMVTSIIGLNILWISTIKLFDIFWSDRFRGVISYSPLLVCVFGVIMGGLVKTLSVNYFHIQGTILWIRARAAVVGLLYKKVRK